MKQMLLTILILFFAISYVKAQTSEVISELKPLPKKVKKPSKKLSNFGGDVIDNNPLDFEVKIERINLPNDKKLIAVVIQISNKEVVFVGKGEKVEANLNIFGRIISVDRTTGGIFEDQLLVRKSKNDLENSMKDSIIFRKVFALSEGRFKIDIIVRDLISGNSGIRSVGLQIDTTK